MPVIIAEIAAYAFWALVLALLGGRLTLLALKLSGNRDSATRFARTFNRYTEYLRP